MNASIFWLPLLCAIVGQRLFQPDHVLASRFIEPVTDHGARREIVGSESHRRVAYGDLSGLLDSQLGMNLHRDSSCTGRSVGGHVFLHHCDADTGCRLSGLTVIGSLSGARSLPGEDLDTCAAEVRQVLGLP